MPSKSKKIDKQALINALEMMLLMRRFEERAGQLYGMGLIGGFCHLYIGQEAVAAGVQDCLKEGDQVITSYRDHGLMLATGSCPKGIMAELLGRETGCSKGKGGSMHMFDLDKGFYGGHGIVGAQVPIGTGMEFANKYLERDNITVVYFGDGAVNQGQVYEAFNMASLWKLPTLFIIENNKYSMGTSTQRACSNSENLHKRGESFGISGKKVDGMDYMEVRDLAGKAIDEIRAGGGPQLLEMETYRYRGHSMSDPGQYRTKDEVNEYKNVDPITKMLSLLKKKKYMTDDEYKALDKKVRDNVAEIVKFAEESNEPSEDELFTDVYRD